MNQPPSSGNPEPCNSADHDRFLGRIQVAEGAIRKRGAVFYPRRMMPPRLV